MSFNSISPPKKLKYGVPWKTSPASKTRVFGLSFFIELIKFDLAITPPPLGLIGSFFGNGSI